MSAAALRGWAWFGPAAHRTLAALGIGVRDSGPSNDATRGASPRSGRLREERRLRVGDDFIGKLLAASPPDPDGAWPGGAVRDVLETVESEQLARGFATEIVNSLGVTSRGALDGGDQERSLSAVYREQAQRFVDAWPKTAALLRDAADVFERMARDHDADAERRRTGF